MRSYIGLVSKGYHIYTHTKLHSFFNNKHCNSKTKNEMNDNDNDDEGDDEDRRKRKFLYF